MQHSALNQDSFAMLCPLDRVEELLIQRDLNFDRPADDEVVGEISSVWGMLRLWYRWEDSLNMLVFSAAFDQKINKMQRLRVAPLLMAINEKLWLGHFDLTGEDGTIIFRYSMLSAKPEDISLEQLESLLEIAVVECDRFYPALQAVLWGNQNAEEALSLALFETQGEA